ncbi:fimbria/pilus outer membrane usher protein [Serratia ficaria]|uniref:fimbria/pilus outer membrane usher protein n=1 Tax=Serratia ficaria TaxID=61651 RepID=UPI002177C6EC|nr:fimbria/pilus outer membrane usher protein [Serratia ficaria]CAI1507952.1 Outer membrane usher protein fimD precursor [Serratia ficaria]
MKLTRHPTLRLAALAAALLCTHGVAAEDLWFPPGLISETGEGIDLTRFTKGEQLPGSYKVSVFINQEPQGIRDLNFIAADTDEKRAGITDGTGLMAALTRRDLTEMGVRPEAFGSSKPAEEDNGQPLSPGSVIPQATTRFDFQQMRLDISIPHKWMQKRPRNWVSPERWDNGITAGVLNYDFSGTNGSGRYGHSSSHYLRLNAGLNVGPWRLRDERTMSDYSSGQAHSHEWRHGRTWLERGIPAWRSALVAGDTTTDGSIFDSAGLRGVSLMTDDNMYPDQERGYAPVIRGTALSNARVRIRQSGYVVYETNVAPGEFVIDDINPMYSSGDLEVTVTEADGSTRIFTVPYATLPVLLREGRTRYALNAGQLRESGRHDPQHPGVVQSTLSRGLPYGVTAYGGMQYSRKYRSAALGSGINMGAWGAFSADVTHADSRLADGSRHRGQSVRFLYSRAFDTTGTTFQLAGYRYSTRGFFTLEESNRSYMSGWMSEQRRDATGRLLPHPLNDWYNLKDNRRERMEMNVSQRMGSSSSLYLTGSRQTFWNSRGASTSLQAGYSSALGPVSYSLGYSESYSPSQHRTDRGMNLSLSVPLGSLFAGAGKTLYASASVSRDGDGEMAQQASLSGTALEQNNLNWTLSQGHSRRSGESSSGHLAWRGAYGDLSAGYSQGRDHRQFSYDAAGSLLVHRGGITPSQPLGSTSVLVSVPGAAGIPLEGGNGVRTDGRGYAVLPWASEYHENRVALDVAHLDTQTEVEAPVTRVVPSKGAIVRAEFVAKTGLRALVTLTKDGKPLPFGATVTAGDSGGMVGDDGLVYLTGLARSGTLTAKWGNGAGESCHADWHISETDAARSPVRATAACR